MERAERHVAATDQNEGEQGAQQQHTDAAGHENVQPSVLHAAVTQLDELDAGLLANRTAASAEHGHRRFADERGETGLRVVARVPGRQDGAAWQ